MFCQNCGKAIEPNSRFCTNCGAKADSQSANASPPPANNRAFNTSTTKRPVYIKVWFWVLSILFFVFILPFVLLIFGAIVKTPGAGNSASSSTSSSVSSNSRNSGQSSKSETPSSSAIILPPQETRFIEIVSTAQKQSRQANNDMQKGGFKASRDKALCELMTSLSVVDWVGTIDKIDSNSEGKGVLEVSIAPDIKVKTWNNSLSDIDSKTLIEPSSPVFAAASAMKRGQKVVFSGAFVRGSEGSCIEEGSLTLDGKIREPEFIFRFSQVGPYDPAKQSTAVPQISLTQQPATSQQTQAANIEIDACVEKWVEAHRKQAGLDTPIPIGQIEEWEGWCRSGKLPG